MSEHYKPEVPPIDLSKDKTFSYLAHRNYYVPEQLLDEISKTIRHLVESGKDTLLVRYGNGAERLFIDCFLALRSEYPNLRLIKVTYDEDKLPLPLPHPSVLQYNLQVLREASGYCP